MATNIYTQPNTYVNGDAFSAPDTVENLQGIQEAIAQGISSDTHMDVSSVTTSKILRPRTDLIGLDVVSTYLQSGSIHIINHPLMFWNGSDPLSNVPYQTRGYITNVTSPVTSGPDAFQPVPQSWVTFYADRTPLAVLVRLTATIIIPKTDASVYTDNRFHLRLVDEDGVVYDDLGSTCRVRSQDSNPINDLRTIATQALFTDATQGTNHVGIVYGLESNFGLLAGMTMTVEVFY